MNRREPGNASGHAEEPALIRQRSDDDLLCSGEPADFGMFYRRHVEWVLGFLSRRTRDPELAADLCAEVFAAALVARRRYRRGNGEANAWLHRIAINKLADAQRQGYADDRARRRLGMERVVPHEDDLRQIAGLGDEVRAVRVLDQVRALPPEQRRAVTARVLDERPYDDIAAQHGVSQTVARKRVSRGLAALRSGLGRHP